MKAKQREILERASKLSVTFNFKKVNNETNVTRCRIHVLHKDAVYHHEFSLQHTKPNTSSVTS